MDAVSGKESNFKRLSQKEMKDILALIETVNVVSIPEDVCEETPIKLFNENQEELRLKREYQENDTAESMKLYKYLESKGVL